MPKPGPDRGATDEEILRFLVVAYEPALGTADVADHFDVETRTALNWLDDLHDDGLVEKGIAGHVAIWWPSDRGRQVVAHTSTSSDAESSDAASEDSGNQ